MASWRASTPAGSANIAAALPSARSRQAPGPGSSTRSPGFRCVTPAPTFAIFPTPSAPGTIGSLGGVAPYLPSRFRTSAGLIGKNSVCTSASPEPGSPGSGSSTTSITSSGLPNLVTCATSMESSSLRAAILASMRLPQVALRERRDGAEREQRGRSRETRLERAGAVGEPADRKRARDLPGGEHRGEGGDRRSPGGPRQRALDEAADRRRRAEHGDAEQR